MGALLRLGRQSPPILSSRKGAEGRRLHHRQSKDSRGRQGPRGLYAHRVSGRDRRTERSPLMPFVKLDTAILESSLWIDRAARDMFMTALLMAEPREFTTPMPQYYVDRIEQTGFSVPPGWYGFVAAAGVGIARRAFVEQDEGIGRAQV